MFRHRGRGEGDLKREGRWMEGGRVGEQSGSWATSSLLCCGVGAPFPPFLFKASNRAKASETELTLQEEGGPHSPLSTTQQAREAERIMGRLKKKRGREREGKGRERQGDVPVDIHLVRVNSVKSLHENGFTHEEAQELPWGNIWMPHS